MGNYWDKFVGVMVELKDKAIPSLNENNPLLGRWFEESGIPDVIEELARFDDEDLSFTKSLGILMSTAGQAVSAPLQGLSNLAPEVNRAGGALLLDTMDRGPGALGIPGFTLDEPSRAWYNYANDWRPPQYVQKQDGTYEQAPGVYEGATLGGVLIVLNDQVLSNLPELPISPYQLSPIYSPIGMGVDPGPYKNGTYVPESFDIYAPGLGAALADSDLRYSALVGDLSVEIALDPLNLLAAPIGAAIKARRGLGVAPTKGAALTDAEQMLGEAKRQTALRRMTQRKPSVGMVDQRQMAYALTHGEGLELSKALADNTDYARAMESLRPFITDNVARSRVAQLSLVTNDADDVFHLFNAVTYRNVDSINRMKSLLDDSSKINVFDTLTETGDNLLSRTLAEFPEGTILPQGHPLAMDAQSFLDDALEANPHFKRQWESLADEVRDKKFGQFETQLAARQKALDLTNVTFGEGTQADRLVDLIPANRGAKKATRALTGTTTFAERLAGHVSKAIPIPGGAHRFSPKFLLTSRPGLIFSVDAIDAGDKLDDFINYADHIIGTSGVSMKRGIGGRSIGNILPEGYRFALDPEVLRIRNAFWDAAAVTDNPSMARAAMMDELQHYAIRKIAESSGYEAEVAEEIAKMGMDKARNINAALNSAEVGYMTTLVEDGNVIVVKNHPTTIEQTANFVPIMDIAGVRKALHSAPMRKYVNNDRIASIVRQNFDEGYIGLDDVGDLDKFARRNAYGAYSTKRFGRNVLVNALVDIADVVATTFKLTVLLRLGYTVRNLSEGALAAVGSGVGLTHVMANADLLGLVDNTLYNTKTAAARMTDRLTTWGGIKANEIALYKSLGSYSDAIGIGRMQLDQMAGMIADPARERTLLRIVNNPESTESEIARAREALDYIAATRLRVDLPQATLFHADLDSTVPIMRQANGQPMELTAGVNRINQSAQLNRPISLTPNSSVAQARIDSQWSPFHMSNRPYGSRNQRPRWATRTVRNEVDGQEQWTAMLERFESMQDTHIIQYRANAESPWRRFLTREVGDPSKPRAYRHDVAKNYEFRFMEKTAARRDKASNVGVQVFGDEIDLRAPEGKQSLLSRFSDIDESMIDDAVAGSREAQNKLADRLARHGIYRAVYTDSPEWGGINVIVHPDGIGGKAFKEAIKRDVEKRIADDLAMQGSDSSAVVALNSADARQLRGWNRGEEVGMRSAGVLADRDAAFREIDVFKNSGFDDVLDEAIQNQVDLMRKHEGLVTAAMVREAEVGRLSKRRGLAETQVRLESMYGPSELRPDMLHGVDGFKYRTYTSADATTANTIAQSSYRADLLDNIERSMLEPMIMDGSHPRYFDSVANLTGRYYTNGVPGKVLSEADVDPVVWRALQSGDRQRLYEETLDWAVRDPKGRQWVRSMGLESPDDSGRFVASVDDMAEEAAERRAGRVVKYDTSEARGTGVGVTSYRRSVHDYDFEVSVGELIADQFNFVDNYINANPAVRQLFLEGRLTGASLRELYAEAPWDLLPLNAAHAPTAAEYRRLMHLRDARKQSMMALNDKINKGLGIALNKIGSAPETRLLRHPMFRYIAQTDFQQRVTHAEMSLGRPLSEVEKLRLAKAAKQYAVKKVKETLYTLEGRSTMEEYLRFVSPFFPAWWNTLSRWGKFYMNNPANPARIASRWNTIEQSGLIVDENGNMVRDTGGSSSNEAFNHYLMVPVGVTDIPVVGDWFGRHPGAEQAMTNTRIPMRSFDVVFQGDAVNPGAGPFLAVPMQWLLTERDDWFQSGLGRSIIERIMPVGPEVSGTDNRTMDVVNQFLPTAARRLIERYTQPDKWAAQYNQNVQLLYTMRLKGEYEGDDQKLFDDAMRLTKSMSWVKVWSSLLSPVAQQQVGYPEFIAGQYRELQDEAVAMGHPELADDFFFRQYPIDFLLTISSTSNLTRAPSTSWVTDNQKKYDHIERIAFEQFDDPELLWFSDSYQKTPDGQGVVGNVTSDDYNPYSRRWQVYHGPAGTDEKYRTVKDPSEVLREGQIRAGWMMYDQVEAAVEARLVASGLPYGSWEFLKQRKDAMGNASAQLARMNPVWANSRGVIDTQRFSRNAQFFNMLVNDQKFMEDKKSDNLMLSIASYLQAREAAAVEMEQRGLAKTSSALANLDIGARLEYKAIQLGANSPSFRLWHNRYFRNDIVNVDEVG